MKNNVLKVMLVFLSLILLLIGCSNGEKDVLLEDNLNEKIDIEIEEDNEIPEKEDEEKEEKEEKTGTMSPLSGLYASEEKVSRRPVAVMYDNHPRARWQAGIGQAEVIYEFRVEYPYTRYMALFLINDPSHIGPVRSSRPYFVTTLLEYDPLYVRVGGSEAAKAYIKELKVADIDGLSSTKEVFWRYYDTNKKAPNNLYTSMEAIRKTQKDRGYNLSSEYEGFKFNDDDSEIIGESAREVLIKYNKENSTKYEYDDDNKVYKRYKDGKLHKDELDDSGIIAKNIIIQKANTEVIDDVGRLSIDLVSNGDGMYITNGKIIDITWKKDSKYSKTYYYDKNNNEIILNPGVTWIQVVPLNTSITIN